MRFRPSLLAAVAPFVALVAFAPRAHASESYPKTIERALDTPCAPDCTTCHTRPSGGALTANTPVGISARRAGLEGGDTSQLLDVLGTLETNRTDSDADGTPDVEELRAGTNPNALEGKLKCYVPPAEDGCAVGSCAAPSSRRTSWFAPLAALALAAFVRRRAARRQSQ